MKIYIVGCDTDEFGYIEARAFESRDDAQLYIDAHTEYLRKINAEYIDGTKEEVEKKLANIVSDCFIVELDVTPKQGNSDWVSGINFDEEYVW